MGENMKKRIVNNMPQFNDIKEIILNSVKLYPDNIAFTTKSLVDKKVAYKEITYRELLEDVNSFGTSLYNLGLKDKRVAIIGKNQYEWVVAHLSNLLGNMVSIPLDKELQIEELESSLERSEADVLIFDEKFDDYVKQIKEKNNTNVTEYICMNKHPSYRNMPDLIEEGKELISRGNNQYINANIDAEKMSILLFTSGTSAKSKAVMLSQKNITTNVYDMQIDTKFYDDDVNIAFLPFHHVFGGTGIFVMLSSGVKTVFPDGLRYIKQNLIEYGVTVFIGVPILIEKMYQGIEKEIKKQKKEKTIAFAKTISGVLFKLHIDIRRKIFKQIIDQLGGKLRLIVSGGAALDIDVLHKFKEFGINVIQGYGLSETAPVIANESDINAKEGSVGKPMPSLSIDIVNKDKDGIGEIIVRGPSVMLGYYKNDEENARAFDDGWFNTGDLGYIDKQGYLFITGRKKDMIALKNGKKIFPEELESVINRLEEVEESYIYGMQDDRKADDLKVSVKIVYDENVIKKIYNNITESKLYEILWEKIKKINKALPKYKYIKNMILTKEPLIKTTTNKIKRNEEEKKQS